MSWIKMPGVDGLVWEPDWNPVATRKHNCRDCFDCQMCSDARCDRCLKRKAHIKGSEQKTKDKPCSKNCRKK